VAFLEGKIGVVAWQSYYRSFFSKVYWIEQKIRKRDKKDRNSPYPRRIPGDPDLREHNQLRSLGGGFSYQITCLIDCGGKVEPDGFVLGYCYFECV
jgi:hypothetical protein